jgi:hypothetical protein
VVYPTRSVLALGAQPVWADRAGVAGLDCLRYTTAVRKHT